MLVGSHRQLIATTQAAAFEYSAPISRGHALAESMHAQAAADLRLIRTFYHSSFLTLKILRRVCWLRSIYLQIEPTQIGTTLYRKGSDSVN